MAARQSPTSTRSQRRDAPADDAQPQHERRRHDIEDDGIPEPVADVIDTERPAGRERGDGHNLSVSLFRPKEEARDVTLEEAARSASSAGDEPETLAWVDLSAYSEEELDEAGEAFNLEARAVRTAKEGWRRPRLAFFPEQFLVNVTVPDCDFEARKVEARELDIFAGRGFVVSAHRAPLPFFEGIQQRATSSSDLVLLDSAYMLFIILDELLGFYEHIFERVEDEIEEMEERALTDPSDGVLNDLLLLKRFVFALSRLAEQHREVFAAFLRPDFEWVSGADVEPYFRDLQARHGDIVVAAGNQRAAVNGAFDIYVSNVAHRTNHIVKVLTMVSAVLLPLSAIFALFGTNFTVDGLYSNHNFWFMLAGAILITLFILGAFRWRHWM